MKEAAATMVVGACREGVAQSDGQIRETGKKGDLVGFGWLRQPRGCLLASSNPYSEHTTTETQRRSPALPVTEIKCSICNKIKCSNSSLCLQVLSQGVTVALSCSNQAGARLLAGPCGTSPGEELLADECASTPVSPLATSEPASKPILASQGTIQCCLPQHKKK